MWGGTPNGTILFQRHNDLTTLFIYPTLSSASITIFITNVAVSLGWLRGK